MGEEDLVTRMPLSSPPATPAPTVLGVLAAWDWLFTFFHGGLKMEATRSVKRYLHSPQLSGITIQIRKPLRTSPSENRDNFLIIGEIKNTKVKQYPQFH